MDVRTCIIVYRGFQLSFSHCSRLLFVDTQCVCVQPVYIVNLHVCVGEGEKTQEKERGRERARERERERERERVLSRILQASTLERKRGWRQLVNCCTVYSLMCGSL